MSLRVGQSKGPMWPLLRYDMKKAFIIGSKFSHMVTCIGHVLYSPDSLYESSPTRVYMTKLMMHNFTIQCMIYR